MMNKKYQLAHCYKSIQLPEMHSYNEEIYGSFLRMKTDDYDNKSHYFHGRYENIYINEKKIPALATVLQSIKQEVSRYLKVNPEQIKMGFWLNEMKANDITSRHCHDDLDEILSGVYYIRVPEQCGNLVLYLPDPEQILPQEGMLVIFSPTLEHEVQRNNSGQIRLSIGFNVGLIETNASG